MIESLAELGTVFMECPFYLKEQLLDKLYLPRFRYLADIFLKMNTAWKTTNSIWSFVNDQIQLFKQELRTWKTYIYCLKFHSIPKFKRLYWWDWWWFQQMWFWVSYNEICQYLADVHNSVNLYFLNDQNLMLQKYVWVKDPSEMQDRPMNFNVPE